MQQRQTRKERFNRLRPALACPSCRVGLDTMNDGLACPNCRRVYPVRDFRAYFIEVPQAHDPLDRTKAALKKLLGKLYYTIGIDIIAPTFPFPFKKVIEEYLDPAKQLVVDAGCGNRRVHDAMFCFDMFDYEEVDVVCDLEQLPLLPESVDAFVTRSVLEHVPSPWVVVEHFRSCTKPAGLGVHLVPFLFPVHASPYDFHRFTADGLKKLFSGFSVLKQYNASGPVTLFLLCMIEFLSIIFSFGHSKAKGLLYLFFCGILFPIKFLDVFFVKRDAFLTIAPNILTVIQRNQKK